MDWESWKQEHGKRYSDEEDAEKKKAWEATLAKVTAHNEKYDQGLVCYQLGMTQFAVQPPRLMEEPDCMEADCNAPPIVEMMAKHRRNDGKTTEERLPECVDYLNQATVTSVKDQGDCGSCYAFAAVGVIEAQHSRVNETFVSLSAQQLVDCSDNKGCDGGFVSKCFEYAKNGLATSDDYPYQGKQGPCQKKQAEIAVKNYWVHSDGEDSLKKSVAHLGPVAVTLHIPDAFFYIKNATEVFDSQDPGVGYHSVLVVGYGTQDYYDRDYWIIKNSWGTRWGGSGYALLKRGINLFGIGNQCCFANVINKSDDDCSVM